MGECRRIQLKLFNEYRNLFTSQELANLWGGTVCQPNWRYGQTSRPDLDLQFPMWFQEFWSPWEQKYFDEETKNYVEVVKNKFYETLPAGDWVLTRSMVSGNTFGLDGDIHQDWIKPNESMTGVLYLNGDWQDNWGGETIIYNEDDKTQIEISKVEHGKLITFDGYNSHIGKGPQRRCPRLRCIFALQAVRKEPFIEWAGEKLKVDL